MFALPWYLTYAILLRGKGQGYWICELSIKYQVASIKDSKLVKFRKLILACEPEIFNFKLVLVT